jgi:EAL domain-containing protein (putative c-di-GMP-specific phosphodiesterase class I)
MADTRLSANVFSQIQHLGSGIILDGFGMARSSLNDLRLFPVDALKIDRCLVSEILTNRGASDVVALIVTIAHKLNLKAIAEGIETGTQLGRLREFGCDAGQGYLFSQPLNSESAQQFLSHQLLRVNGAHGI